MLRGFLGYTLASFGNTHRRVFRNFGALTALQALNYILPLVALPFLVRVLGIEQFGMVSFVRGTMLVLFLIVDYGFTYSATKRVSVERDNLDKLADIAASVTGARLVMAAACCLGIGILCVVTPRFSQISGGFVLSLGAVIGYALIPNWFFMGLEKLALLTAVSGASRVGFILSLLLFVHSPADGLKVIALESLSYLIAGGLGIYLVRRELSHISVLPTRDGVGRALVEGWHYFLTTAAISTYTSLIIPLLGLMTNNAAVGVYVAGERPIRAITSLVTPLVQVMYPVMTRLAAHSQNRARVFSINFKLLLLVAAGMSIVSGLTAVMAPEIVLALYGAPMPLVVMIIRVLAPMPLLVACASVTLNLGVLALGQRQAWSRTIYTATGIGLFSLVLLVHLLSLGGVGAAISAVLAEGFVCISGIYLFVRLQTVRDIADS
jgi:PST family polysaccharide transporter